MEGKAVDYKKIAYNEYMDSKDKSRFTSLAQKLAQHLNHLSEDKNSRIRWVWELIQNAKDVPNQFGKCKMRIEIRDDKLIFAHNGDPFRVSDLQSLVAQYSSKAEENNVNTETTGKYGTGFITTYIVSKKVRIKGLLSMKTKEQMASAEKQSVEDVIISKEDEIGGEKFSEFEEEISESKIKKSQQRNFQGGSLYQRFEIFLDRDYKDRDQELFYKLMRTERNLLEDLLKNEPKPKWQRTEDDLNTQFIYEELDEAAFRMITDAMNCLKELFPYTLLFNSKLSEIQMIDKREGKRLKNFGIKRMEPSKYNNIDIFNAKILEQGKEARTFSIAYISDEETYSILAMPVCLSEGLQLLEVNHNFPKMFKQFPLIGCKDHGFNFVFTSKQFYPNETRSDLLLSQIQGRNSKKSRANWEAIANIFNHGLQMYKTLAQSISHGQQNILIVSMNNQFTHEDHKQNRIDKQLLQFQKDISQLKFIQFRSGRRGGLNELVFPLGKSQKNNCQHQDYSVKLNSLFAKLLGDNVTLADETYKSLYCKLLAYSQVWKQFIQFKQVYDCIAKINTISFQNLAYIMGDKENALNWLESLYDFLHKYNPSFMTQDKVTPPTENKGLNFVLTNKMVFQDLKRTVKGSTLMIKEHLSQGYEQIALQIGLSISQITIHDRFAKYFLKVKKFRVEEMFQLYRSVFFVEHYQGNPDYLVQLGRFITTFKIKSEFMDIALKLKKLSNADVPFIIKDPEFKLMMSDQQQKQYRYLFELKLMRYLNQLLNTYGGLSKLLDETIFMPSQKTKAIAWLNDIYRLEAKLIGQSKYKEYQSIRPYCPKVDKKAQKGGLFGVNQEAIQKSLIQKGLSMSENFVDNYKLKQFCYFENESWYQGNYPSDADIKMYDKMRVIENHNRQESNNKSPYKLDLIEALRQQITHPQITYKPATVTTFTKMFDFIVPLYKLKNSSKDSSKRELNDGEKTELLNYIYDLRQAAIRDKKLAFKLEVFDELQKQAHYEYPQKAKSITKKQDQVYAFHLMKNPKELQAAMQISQMCGNLAQALIQLKKYRESQKKTA